MNYAGENENARSITVRVRLVRLGCLPYYLSTTLLYGTVRYATNPLRGGTVQYGTVRHSTLQYSTVL